MQSFSVTVPSGLANAICGPVFFVLYSVIRYYIKLKVKVICLENFNLLFNHPHLQSSSDLRTWVDMDIFILRPSCFTHYYSPFTFHPSSFTLDTLQMFTINVTLHSSCTLQSEGSSADKFFDFLTNISFRLLDN